jgi:predicted transcriptional regulator
MMKSDRRNVSSSLSARIIAYLVQHNHSQVDIARLLGVSQGFVSLVKSRERCLTLDHLERMSESLSVPLGAFLLAVTEPRKGSKYPKELFKMTARLMKMGDKLHRTIMRSGMAPRRRKAS